MNTSYICILIGALIVAFFVIDSAVRKGIRKRNARKAVQREQHLLEDMWREAIGITEQYKTALLRQRRQKLYTDPYGRVIADDWNAELKYFVQNVLIPHLRPNTAMDWVYASLKRMEAEARVRNVPTTIEITLTPQTATMPILETISKFIESVAAELPELGCDTDDPFEFEAICDEQLARAGWRTQRVGAAGDQGADVIGERGKRRGVFQCKLYEKPVGNSAVQEAHAAKAFYNANFAAVVSRSGYTNAARQAAAAMDVYLLDFNELGSFEAS